MDVGIIVPHVGRDNVSKRSIDAMCVVAEELGADALWFGDHVAFPYNFTTPYPYGTRSGFTPADPEQFWEAYSVMAYVAARTERVKLCTGVIILPYRHPLLTAKSVATIDMLSGGRVMFGAGVGWLEEEFQALGLDTFRQRGAVSDEQLEIIKRAWTGDRPSFAGKFYEFPEVSVTPRPFQQPHPPILIGGNGAVAFRRVVRFGDYWHSAMLLPEEVEDGRDPNEDVPEGGSYGWGEGILAHHDLPHHGRDACRVDVGSGTATDDRRHAGSGHRPVEEISASGFGPCIDDRCKRRHLRARG
jgi:probable F420-dependent oxidoreductase